MNRSATLGELNSLLGLATETDTLTRKGRTATTPCTPTTKPVADSSLARPRPVGLEAFRIFRA